MFAPAFVAVSLISAAAYFLILPIFDYFRDKKGLRRFPAFTTCAGLSDLPYCLLSAKGSRSADLHKLHEVHPVLRIGPNALSFGRTPAIKDIYGFASRCIKDRNYEITGGSHTHLIDSVDKQEHSRKRKLMSAAFAIKNLERWEFKVAEATERLVASLDSYCPESLGSDREFEAKDARQVNFGTLINLWTIEAINNICLSSRLGLIEQGDDSVVAERMDGTKYQAFYREAQNQTSRAQAAFVWSYNSYHWLCSLSKLFPTWRKVWEQAEPWNDVVYHQVMERLRRYQAGEQLDDFFSCLMDDKSGLPNNLEMGEIVAEIGIIINAGADTTAIALSQILVLLLQHPMQLRKLREELDGAMDPDDIVASYEAVKDLPYLRACLDEGMRLLPPTSAGLARRTPTEGAQILGHWIPGDTSVSMTIYSAHRDPEIFPEPEAFKPERWLSLEARKSMEPYFIPFTTGARGCIGRNISYLEQIVVLATLVHRYDFQLPSADWELMRHEAFNIIVGEIPLSVRRRDVNIAT